jgi:hypothetical protein
MTLDTYLQQGWQDRPVSAGGRQDIVAEQGQLLHGTTACFGDTATCCKLAGPPGRIGYHPNDCQPLPSRRLPLQQPRRVIRRLKELPLGDTGHPALVPLVRDRVLGQRLIGKRDSQLLAI